MKIQFIRNHNSFHTKKNGMWDCMKCEISYQKGIKPTKRNIHPKSPNSCVSDEVWLFPRNQNMNSFESSKSSWKTVLQLLQKVFFAIPKEAHFPSFCPNTYSKNGALIISLILSKYWADNSVTFRSRWWGSGVLFPVLSFPPPHRVLQFTHHHVSAIYRWWLLCLILPQPKISLSKVSTLILCVIGANILALAGYSDTQIQKMGHWHGETLKEFICKQYQISLRGCEWECNISFGLWMSRTVFFLTSSLQLFC